MTQRITWEARARILSRIKDDGVSIADAARDHNVHEATIRRWLRATQPKPRDEELLRLRRENQRLKRIVGSLVLERHLADPVSSVSTDLDEVGQDHMPASG